LHSPFTKHSDEFGANFSVQKEENGLLRGKDEMESGSGSEQVEEKSGNEQETEQPPKKKRYHRHTARQIQEMEAYDKLVSFMKK
jgi:hypothetical protein